MEQKDWKLLKEIAELEKSAAAHAKVAPPV